MFDQDTVVLLVVALSSHALPVMKLRSARRPYRLPETGEFSAMTRNKRWARTEGGHPHVIRFSPEFDYTFHLGLRHLITKTLLRGVKEMKNFHLCWVLSCLLSLGLAGQSFASPTILIPQTKPTLANIPADSRYNTALEEARGLKNDGKAGSAVARMMEEYEASEGKAKGRALRLAAYFKLDAGDKAGAEADFATIARGEVPISEADYLDSRVRLAYLKLARGDREAALEEFQFIANGTIKATPAVATDAALRTGALYRLLSKNHEAIHVYEQIARQAPKIDDRLYAKLQIAGLLWETGKGDYGEPTTKREANVYFQQSMKVAQEIFTHPEVIPKTKAIAELIYLEGYYFQEDYETARDLAAEYTAKWLAYASEHPQKEGEWNPDRQIVTAQTWLCFCQYRTGQYEECIQTARQIRSGIYDEDDPYKNFNVFGYSMLYEAFSQEALGNPKEGERLRALAFEQYPSWYNAVIDSVEAKLRIGRIY